MPEERRPKAFISCSLDPADEPFVTFVESLVDRFGFHPFGTVGRYSAAPEPIWQQMKENIQASDCVVLIATPRFIRQDVRDRSRTGKGMSDHLHVELGMAVMTNRPVLAFVQEGTDIGSFLPHLVQYIVLNPRDRVALEAQSPLIANYFRSALSIIQNRWREENRKDLLYAVGAVLAIIGGAAVLEAVVGEEDNE